MADWRVLTDDELRARLEARYPGSDIIEKLIRMRDDDIVQMFIDLSFSGEPLTPNRAAFIEGVTRISQRRHHG